MIAKTFYSLTQHLREQIPQLVEIEMYSGQYRSPSDNNISVPAVYIAFESIDFSNIQGNSQIAESTIALHIVSASLQDFDGIFQTSETDEVFSLLDDIHQSIHGWRATNKNEIISSPFSRQSMAQILGYEPLQIWKIDYSAVLHENKIANIFKPDLNFVPSRLE